MKKPETTKDCECSGEWVGDKYHGNVCSKHIDEIGERMAKLVTTLPPLPDGFSYVVDGDYPCRIVVCDSATTICRTEYGNPVEAATRAIEELKKEVGLA